jgi:hypothetical protein
MRTERESDACFFSVVRFWIERVVTFSIATNWTIGTEAIARVGVGTMQRCTITGSVLGQDQLNRVVRAFLEAK